MTIPIKGYCPMGCGETLMLGSDQYVGCSHADCPRPDAAGLILADQETEHLVQFSEETFTVIHPLRERLDDALLDCQLHAYCASLDGPPLTPGLYRALDDGDDWAWEPAGRRP